MKTISCFLGFHKWFKLIPSERTCECCKKHQRYVVYPYRSSAQYWETVKFKLEDSWLRYEKFEYRDGYGNWYPYQMEFLKYFYPKQTRKITTT